jgi:hypothetical protein
MESCAEFYHGYDVTIGSTHIFFFKKKTINLVSSARRNLYNLSLGCSLQHAALLLNKLIVIGCIELLEN